jgi:predicted glycosyltransferase
MKIWLDFCEPKSVIMLRPLYEKLIVSHDVFITARNFDSTFYLLDKWGVDYIPIGGYGGETLLGKLKAYSERLSALIEVIEKRNPDFLFCITSPEALRTSFGLQIPNLMFNDEPRSYGPCTTTFPYVNQIIVPQCIPLEWYLDYGIKKEKIIRFNGIDEVGWLSGFKPDKGILKTLDLVEDQFIVCRTEPSKAGYLSETMKSHETKLTKIIPELLNKHINCKFLILSRSKEQFLHINEFFRDEIERDLVRSYRELDNLAHIMYFSKLVLSGGGTMVRESALLGVPSIEFIPLNTYPQERFLMEEGFPLKHFQNSKDIVEQAVAFIKGSFKINTKSKIKELENPIEIGYNEFLKRIG